MKINALISAAVLAALGASCANAATPVNITASSHDGNVPANTVDNDLSTRWSANGNGEFIQYDLGQEFNVESIDIAFFKGNERSATFDVLTSTDGSNWTTVFSGVQGQETTAQQNVALDSSVGRYVQIVGYGNTSNTWNSITEVDINTSEIETGGGEEPETPAPSEVTASASSDDGNVAENVLDGSLDTRWSANGDGQWLALDLGASQTVGSVELAFFKGDQRSTYFEIETSSNGSSWTPVLTNGSSSGSSTSLESFSVAETEARYVRYVGFGNSSNTWNSVTEFSVSSDGGSEGGTTPETPEVPEVPTPPTGDAEHPSDLMRNFDQWKITFPDGEEVKQLENVSNEYFYVNDAGDGIVFFAPVRSDNGTTPNSSYIRSELREREEDGSKDIYWTTDGTHVVYAQQAITHLPIVKSHLVATQIHGNKDEGIDDALVLRLEDEHLFLSFNGGKLRDDVTVKTDYVLGTKHEVIFEVVDGKHYVYYSEDGNLAAAYAAGNASQYLVKDGSSDYVMDLSYGDSYFKVGNYTQSNAEREGDETDNPENYGEVVVYDFWVIHQ